LVIQAKPTSFLGIYDCRCLTGIDSCPIEGFHQEEAEALLKAKFMRQINMVYHT
jgi:hypothetical protein